MQTNYDGPKPSPIKTDKIGSDDKVLVYWDLPTQRNGVFGVFCQGWCALREFKSGHWSIPEPAVGGANENGFYDCLEDVLVALEKHIPQRN